MLLNTKRYTVALSVAAMILIGCSDGKKFSAGVESAGVPETENAEPTPAPVPTTTKTAAIPAPVTAPPAPKPPATETFNECDKFDDANVVADLYRTSEGEFHSKYSKLPLTNLVYGTPEKTFCMSNLDIPMRPFTEGFPSYPDLKAWFILDTKFTLTVPADGTYTFLMDSDDGSIVNIDGQQLINVDGLRDGNRKVYEKKTIDLKKGTVRVRVQYFQGPGDDLALQFKWQKPGDAAPEVIPLKYIALPK